MKEAEQFAKKAAEGLDQEKDNMLAIKIDKTKITNACIKEHNLIVLAFPLTLPKYECLGFLYSALGEMETYYAAVEHAMKERSKSGLVKGTINDIKNLGSKMFKA